jgi:NAD(P)-dependent dehydrogenase (short-subunit alcohol dehydrogenase family)
VDHKCERTGALAGLTGRVAIVTGGALGIGGATARRLAHDGARVLIADVAAEAAAQNTENIRKAGGTAETLTVDVGTADGVAAMIEHAVSLWGRLDILVNNAYSGGLRGDAIDLSEETWDRAMDIGLKSMYRAAKHAVPEMRKVGGGSMVNISSVHGLFVAPKTLVYETLKAGVIGLTRQFAAEYGPDGIRVNAICPGHIVTERVQRHWTEHPDGLRFFEQQYPLRRTGVPDDIANAISFLCSDQASFITGVTLPVDGGMTILLQENVGVHLAHYIKEHPDTWLPY